MKIKYLFIILSLNLLLTACETTETNKQNDIDIENTFIESVLTEPITEKAEENNQLLNASIKAPDGETIYLKDAVENTDNRLFIFDFGYVRKPELNYFDTFNTPDLYNYETGQFREDINSKIKPNYIKLKKGEEIEGLVVKKAEFCIYLFDNPGAVKDEKGNIKNFELKHCVVEFEGEIKLKGILVCLEENAVMVLVKGDLLFIPKTDGTQFVPIVYSPVCFPYQITYDDFAMYADTMNMYLGNIKDYDWLDGYFEYSHYIHAELTLTNFAVAYYFDTGGNRSKAELKIINIL